MSTASTAIEHALEPLDWLRRRVLRASMPASSYFARRRSERVALFGVCSIALSLALTVVAPMWLLALGPVVLGVPHLLADVRYCVLRPGWHRQPALWLGVGVPLLLVGFGAGSAAGFAAVAGLCAGLDAPEIRPWRRAVGVGVAIVAALICLLVGSSATLVLLHVHNFAAVLLWWLWRARGSGHSLLPPALFVAGCILIASGAVDALALGLAHQPAGLGLEHYIGTLAPGWEGPLGLRLVLSFAFAQSVHYVMWLRLIPEDDRPRETPRSFRASWKALLDELGPLVWLGLFATVFLALWAALDLAAARSGYLRFAHFHAFIEFAALASLWIQGRLVIKPASQIE